MTDARRGYALQMETHTVACVYELVRDDVVVATGQLTLPYLPAVGDQLRIGAVTAKVVEILP